MIISSSLRICAYLIMANELIKKQFYEEVLFDEKKGVRKVVLNRPKQLNTLTYEMLSQMLRRLTLYEKVPDVNFVVLKGNGRAFCAGGEVKSSMSYAVVGHWSFAANYYRRLLNVEYILGTYQKPLVAIMDGIVMGGGAGLTMHSDFRIVTEKTRFAMPEAAIGLFPDCGASHFLSRLPGYLGEYLGLTGAHLNGADMLACGLATHFVLSKDLVAVEEALDCLAAGFSGAVNMSTISTTIDKFVQVQYLMKDTVCQSTRLKVISQCFSMETVEEILLALEEYSSTDHEHEKWILKAINSMKSASPTSLKVFLRLIRQGRTKTLEQCLVSEFRAACHMFRRTINSDYYEGVTAKLIDKSIDPKWMPSKLEKVSPKMVETYFNDVEDDLDWVGLQLPSRSSLLVGDSFDLVSRL